MFQNDKDFLELLNVLHALCFSFDHHKGSSRPKGDKVIKCQITMYILNGCSHSSTVCVHVCCCCFRCMCRRHLPVLSPETGCILSSSYCSPTHFCPVSIVFQCCNRVPTVHRWHTSYFQAGAVRQFHLVASSAAKSDSSLFTC